jgi:cell division septum initiation protein DivIVA
MSASAVVHRGETLELLEQLRTRLRAALEESQSLLDDRDGVVAQGRQEVDRLRAEALAERDRLVAQTSVHQRATDEAARLLADARDEAAAMRAEVEDYVDQKLANFEVVLAKTLEAVQRGRSRLSGHSDLDDLR